MSETGRKKRERWTCGRCRVRNAKIGWCAVRACRRPANAPACEYGRSLIRADAVTASLRRLRGKSADGGDCRAYKRRSPKVAMDLTGATSAAEAMTRHLRKNHGYFGAAAEVKAAGKTKTPRR